MGRNVSNIYRLNVEKLEAAAAAARESYKPKRKISPAKNDPLTVDPSNIDPSTVDPSNFDGSTVDKKSAIRGAMIDPDPSVLKLIRQIKDLLVRTLTQPDPQTAEQDFFNPTPLTRLCSVRKNASGEVRKIWCDAQWIWGRIVSLTSRRPAMMARSLDRKNPTGQHGANDVRTMRMLDGRTHRQICEMFGRVQAGSILGKKYHESVKASRKMG